VRQAENWLKRAGDGEIPERAGNAACATCADPVIYSAKIMIIHVSHVNF
jgi:hypothetical protein